MSTGAVLVMQRKITALELNDELVCVAFSKESSNEVKLLQCYWFVLGIRGIILSHHRMRND